jgi:hypothetical protein
MRENRTVGIAPGAPGNRRPYGRVSLGFASYVYPLL